MQQLLFLPSYSQLLPVAPGCSQLLVRYFKWLPVPPTDSTAVMIASGRPPPYSVLLNFAIAMTLPLVFDSNDPPISYVIADSEKYTTICHTLIVQFSSANMTRSAIIKELEAIGGCIMKH